MQKIAVIALIIVAVVLVSSVDPHMADAPRGATKVDTDSDWRLIRTEDEVDSRVVLRDRAGAVVGEYLVRDGNLYTPQGRENAVEATVIRERYALDPGWDVGAWAGWCTQAPERDDSDGDRLQAGIRFSPLRLGAGVVALDAVISPDVAGAGASVYLPPSYFGRFWRHTGIGAWYVVPYDGDAEPGLAVGLSFSTRP